MMKRTWLKSDSVCLAKGDAVALNLMFETEQDHALFFKCWKKYLSDMADLINYHLSPTGWVLLFKTKSSREIQEAYKDLRSQSNKAKKEHTHVDISRILSEHFRIFLSQFVRKSNAIHGRKGTLVMQRFHKYVFKDSVDYEYFFDMITRRLRNLPQTNRKYQANERGYDVENKMEEDSIWKVGTRIYKGLEVGFKEMFGVLLVSPKSAILRKYLNIRKTPIHSKLLP